MRSFNSIRRVVVITVLLGAGLLCGRLAAPVAAVEFLHPTVEPTYTRQLAPKGVPVNPYVSQYGCSTHFDLYNSDASDSPVPVGLAPEVVIGEQSVVMTTPSFDSWKRPISTIDGGSSIAIFDQHDPELRILGSFSPEFDDADRYPYKIMPAYMTVTKDGRILVPTSDGRVMILRSSDEDQPLDTFQKLADFDVLGTIKAAEGNADLYPRLVASFFDYDGNLWFASGQVRLIPADDPPCFVGYIEASWIKDVIDGRADISELKERLHYSLFKGQTQPDGSIWPGEGPENGLAVTTDGVVVLTNLACYMFSARGNDIQENWRVPYASDGIRGDAASGGGLSWGSGTTPTLANNLILFTDNDDTINLYAVRQSDGTVVAKEPVMRDLPDGTPIAVDTSVLVYGPTEERTSVILLNTFGLYNTTFRYNPATDIELDDIYNHDFLDSGDNSFLSPGLERVDIVQTGSDYRAESVWCRTDITTSAVVQMSTADGLVYIYDQETEGAKNWRFHALDYADGESLLQVPTGPGPEYNNRGLGVMIAPDGNSVYVPTSGGKGLFILRDRYVEPAGSQSGAELNIAESIRHAVDSNSAMAYFGSNSQPVSHIMQPIVRNIPTEGSVDLTFRFTGLDGHADDYGLLLKTDSGSVALGITPLSGFDDEGRFDKNRMAEFVCTLTDGAEYDSEGDGVLRFEALLVKESATRDSGSSGCSAGLGAASAALFFCSISLAKVLKRRR